MARRAPLPRHRLAAAAVTTALAVTLGGLSAAPTFAAPALAASGTVAAVRGDQQDAQDVMAFPADASLYGAGRTGFLSYRDLSGQPFCLWTRYADGVTTTLPAGSYSMNPGTDIVTKAAGTVYTMYDMATGAEPVPIDLSLLGEGFGSARGVGASLVTTKPNADGGRDVHVVGVRQGALVDDTVTGLPADATSLRIDIDSATEFLVMYTSTVDGTPTTQAAVVDVASRAVVERYETGRMSPRWTEAALSATHAAWIERPSDSTPTLVTVRRDTGETRRVPLGTTYTNEIIKVELVGDDWVTYGQVGGYKATSPNPLYALTARSLTTGETVKVLDDLTMSEPGPDNTQLVHGGGVATGEGLYRISPGENGTPVAQRLASTGQTTALTLTDRSVPDGGAFDFDRSDALPVDFAWKPSRSATVTFELTHVATRKKMTVKPTWSAGTVHALWNGTLVSYGVGGAVNVTPAFNGDYTWRMTARPSNGIGPTIEETGTFTVVRKLATRDFNDNGGPDLFVRSAASGELIVFDTVTPLGTQTPGLPAWRSPGWNIYDQLVAPGDLAGSAHGDIVARDKAGVLWLHQGTGHGLAPRVKVSGGWEIYARLTGGSDLTGDGRSDLLATDKAGDLWLHAGTGAAARPFAPRRKIGYGWGVYDRITATGNIGGGPAGDLVARDRTGALWLYLGKGDGTFAARTRILLNWNTVTDFVGIGDIDHDGRADLLENSIFGTPYFYPGTGNWREPFAPSQTVYRSVSGTVADSPDWSSGVTVF